MEEKREKFVRQHIAIFLQCYQNYYVKLIIEIVDISIDKLIE